MTYYKSGLLFCKVQLDLGVNYKPQNAPIEPLTCLGPAVCLTGEEWEGVFIMFNHIWVFPGPFLCRQLRVFPVKLTRNSPGGDPFSSSCCPTVGASAVRATLIISVVSSFPSFPFPFPFPRRACSCLSWLPAVHCSVTVGAATHCLEHDFPCSTC